jgi:hypothetical protein
MAIIKKNILGQVTGKIGNMVIRTVNGKSVASIRPANYNASQTPQAISNRKRFAVVVNFAKYINSIPLLSQVWYCAEVKSVSAFNKILKCNLKLSGDHHPSVNNIITPPGYPVEINNVVLNKNFIELGIIGNVGFAKQYEKISTVAVIVFYDPIDQNKDPFKMGHTIQQLISANSSSSFNIEFKNDWLQLSEEYSQCNLYFAEVAESIETGKLFWSSSVCKSLSLNI